MVVVDIVSNGERERERVLAGIIRRGDFGLLALVKTIPRKTCQGTEYTCKDMFLALSELPSK